MKANAAQKALVFVTASLVRAVALNRVAWLAIPQPSAVGVALSVRLAKTGRTAMKEYVKISVMQRVVQRDVVQGIPVPVPP